MSDLTKRLLDGGLALNHRLAETAANGTDWLFKRDTLIKSGRTWFELVHDDDLMSVRYYDLPDEKDIELADGSRMPIQRKRHPVPLVLVPPLGVTTNTFDLMPQRSLVKFMVASGFDTYLVDWGEPRKEHAGLNLEDYSHRMMGVALDKIRRHSGKQELSMMGWCMGGLLCLLYQGLELDPDIRNIVTVASPIDVQSGGGVVAGLAQAMDAPAKLVSNYTNLRLNAFDPARLGMPPWATTLIFKATDPIGSVTTYWDLMMRLWDREFVESHSTTSDYLNNMLRYPGGVLQDMAVKVMGDNQLAKGQVEVGDALARLDRIESNFIAFAGETDHLVPADIAEASVGIVASKDKEFRVAPGGHMGVILGSKAQGAVWKESAEWLAQRSGAKPARRKKGSARKSAPKRKATARAAPARKRKASPKTKPATARRSAAKPKAARA